MVPDFYTHFWERGNNLVIAFGGEVDLEKRKKRFWELLEERVKREYQLFVKNNPEALQLMHLRMWNSDFNPNIHCSEIE